MSHWAARLIDKPWSPSGEGPDSFYCWGLVRYALRLGFGIEVPTLGTAGTLDEIAAMKARLDWQQVQDKPVERDVVLMASSLRKWPHVGLMVNDGRRAVLLHADGYLSRSGPVGSVVAQPLRDAASGGYRVTEVWRFAA